MVTLKDGKIQEVVEVSIFYNGTDPVADEAAIDEAMRADIYKHYGTDERNMLIDVYTNPATATPSGIVIQVVIRGQLALRWYCITHLHWDPSGK